MTQVCCVVIANLCLGVISNASFGLNTGFGYVINAVTDTVCDLRNKLHEKRGIPPDASSSDAAALAWFGVTGSAPGNKYPVDTMVNALRDILNLNDMIDSCISVNGKVRKCCDGIRSCFVDLHKAVDAAQIRGIDKQKMAYECRILDKELSASEKCVDTWAGVCEQHTNSDVISGHYQKFVGELRTTLDGHCSDQPQNVSTHVPPTYSSDVTSSSVLRHQASSQPQPHDDRTTETLLTTPYLNTTVNTVTFTPTPTGNGSLASPHGDIEGNGDNVVTAGLAAGGVLLFLGVLGVIMWRCRLLFKRPGHHKDFRHSMGLSVTGSVKECDTEIYSEIDDAFMKAVYEHAQTTDVLTRDRVLSSAQVNVCYQSGLEEGGIIPSSRRVATTASGVGRSQPNVSSSKARVQIIHTDEDVLSASKNDSVEISGQTAFLRLAIKKLLPPSKTNVTGACSALPADDSKGSGWYDTITDHQLPTAGEEPVYAAPHGGDGFGGTDNYNQLRDVIMSPSQNESCFPFELNARNVYSHVVSPRNVYVNVEEGSARNNKGKKNKRNERIQNVPEASFLPG